MTCWARPSPSSARSRRSARRSPASSSTWPPEPSSNGSRGGPKAEETFPAARANPRQARIPPPETVDRSQMPPMDTELPADLPRRNGRTPEAPLVARTDHGEASLFQPESLLREARRQKGLPPGRVPPVCVLDPDGDVASYLKATDQA